MIRNRRVSKNYKVAGISLFVIALITGLFLIPKTGLTELVTPETKVQEITQSTFIEPEDQKNGFIKSDIEQVELDQGETQEGYLSPIFNLDNPSNSLGLKWQQSVLGSDVRIWVRVFEQGWSDWFKVEEKDLSETPEQARAELAKNYLKGQITSELIFVNQATKLQYKIKLVKNEFEPTFDEVTFYAIGEPELPTWKQLLSKIVDLKIANSELNIVPRSGWGANEKYTRNSKGNLKWPINISDPNKFILHHDGNARNKVPKSVAEAKTWIRGIYYWHAIGLGWGDIGYNYVVDPWGNIYHGRKGNIGVIGGHTYGQNTNSIGICFLGNYQTTNKPTTAALASYAEFAGTIAGNENFLSKRIYGHKNFAGRPAGRNYTACPGKNVQSKLTWLREKAKVYALIAKQEIADKSIVSPYTSGNIYYIKDGKRYKFLNREVLVQKGYGKTKILNYSPERIVEFPMGGYIVYDDSTLVQAEGKGTVWCMRRGKRYYFSSNEQLAKLGFSQKNIHLISYVNLKSITFGGTILKVIDLINAENDTNSEKTPLVKPSWIKNGWLVQKKSGGSIYLVYSGKKRPILSAGVFKQRGYSWSKIRKYATTTMDKIPTGKLIVYKQNTLLRGKGKGTIWVIKSGKRKYISSMKQFWAKDFSWNKIKTINLKELQRIPNGGRLK